jgi:hypothetical protein
MVAVLVGVVLGELGRFTSSDLRFNAAFKECVESPHHSYRGVVDRRQSRDILILYSFGTSVVSQRITCHVSMVIGAKRLSE